MGKIFARKTDDPVLSTRIIIVFLFLFYFFKQAIVKLDLTADIFDGPLTSKYKYRFSGYEKAVPGPFIRARVGDLLDCTLTNNGVYVVAYMFYD